MFPKKKGKGKLFENKINSAYHQLISRMNYILAFWKPLQIKTILQIRAIDIRKIFTQYIENSTLIRSNDLK
jgi:hypothetical protein